jgi:NADH-quinone oxidoreductase subunit M
LWALQRIIYNKLSKPENEGIKDLNWREIGLLVPLIAAILWIGVYPKPLLEKTEPAARRLVTYVEAAAGKTPVTASNSAR